MDIARSLLENWISKEPVASLWLATAAILLFGVTIARSHTPDDSGRAWGQCLLNALTRSLVFLALAGMFSVLLSSSYASFSQIYGSIYVGDSVSNQHWRDWQRLYGGACAQRDLQVRQYITVETQEVIEPTDPALPLLYRNTRSEQLVPQNSVTRFNARVKMDVVASNGQAETFNGYTLTALYEYDIVNPIEQETHVELRFPLASETRLYQDISVKMDGQDVSAWRIVDGAIFWEAHMSSGQTSTVSIQYIAQGMDSFYFEVPEPRELMDFKFEISVNTGDIGLQTEPENGGIQVDTTQEPPYYVITWTIGHAIIAPHLGIIPRQTWAYVPYYKMIVTLAYAARALLLAFCLVVLTLIICGAPVYLRQITLLASQFALPFLLVMAGDFFRPPSVTPATFAEWQLSALPVLSLLSLSLAFITLRKLPRLPFVLVLVIMAVFVDGYVFIGLLPDEQKRNAAESMVQAGMIAYTVGLTLLIRVRSMLRSRTQAVG